MTIKKIKCDPEDLIARSNCGCYCREGYNFGDEAYLIKCALHEAAPELFKALKTIDALAGTCSHADYQRQASIIVDEVIAKVENKK